MGRTLEGVYPDEISSFEGLTKGKINNGDVINANNVDFLKDYMDEVAFMQVKEMGREIDTHATTMDPDYLSPPDYLGATVKNSGRAKFNADGNVVTDDGSAWIGGNPFPMLKNGAEAFANITMSWGRYDNTFYAIQEDDLNPDGSLAYSYDFAWIEMQATGRTSDPDGVYFKGEQDTVRYQTAWFNAPQDVKGTAFLSTCHMTNGSTRNWKAIFQRLNGFVASRLISVLSRFAWPDLVPIRCLGCGGSLADMG